MRKVKCLTAKKLVFALALAMAFGSVKAQETKETLTLTLDQALGIALNESPTIIVAGQEIEKKQYARKGAIAQLFPQITASAGYTRAIKKQIMYMGGSGGSVFDVIPEMAVTTKNAADKLGLPVSDGLSNMVNQIEQQAASGNVSGNSDGGMEVGQANSWQGGFNLSLPIFAPTLYKSIQLTSVDIELAAEQARASKQDLVNQVSKAYYQLLLAQDSYEVLQQSYKQAEENFTVVRNKFEQGVVSEYDKIRAEVQVRNLNPSLIQARNAVVLTKLQLKVLMGIDGQQDIAVTGQLADYEDNLYVDYMKADTALLANNSNLRQLDFQAQMLRKNYEMDKAAYLPTVSVSALFQYMAMNEDFKISDYKWNPYSTVGVTISVPIFTGGARAYKVKQSKIQMSQLNWNKIDLKRNLNMQVENYLSNMQQSVEQLASNKENVNQALKGRAIAQKRYEVGKGTILELNDSELALTQSKLTYTQAIYDFLVAKTDLDKVLGKDNFAE